MQQSDADKIRSARDAVRDKFKDSLALDSQLAGTVLGKSDEASIDAALLEIASNIEEALFVLHGSAIDEEYKKKYRTLLFNLKDPKNQRLRQRVFTGELPPNILVTLDAADLANEEIERLRKEREHQAIVSKIKTEEDFLVTGRNKFDTFVAAEPGVNSEREMQSKLEESTFEGDAPSPATLGLVEHASGSSLPPHESNADETNLDLPAESAPEEPMEQVPVIEINIGDIGFDATAAQSAPEIPPPTEEPKPDSVWTGTIKYEGFNDLKVRAYHVNGDAIPPALWPAAWNITSRASLPDTLRYLPKIDVSNSRKRTIVIYEPYGEQDIETYEKTITHWKDMGRTAVVLPETIYIPDRAIESEARSFFKEIYIFPLLQDDEVPEFMRKEYHSEGKDRLIGVFLTKKDSRAPTTPSDTRQKTPIRQSGDSTVHSPRPAAVNLWDDSPPAGQTSPPAVVTEAPSTGVLPGLNPAMLTQLGLNLHTLTQALGGQLPGMNPALFAQPQQGQWPQGPQYHP